MHNTRAADERQQNEANFWGDVSKKWWLAIRKMVAIYWYTLKNRKRYEGCEVRTRADNRPTDLKSVALDHSANPPTVKSVAWSMSARSSDPIFLSFGNLDSICCRIGQNWPVFPKQQLCQLFFAPSGNYSKKTIFSHLRVRKAGIWFVPSYLRMSNDVFNVWCTCFFLKASIWVFQMNIC